MKDSMPEQLANASERVVDVEHAALAFQRYKHVPTAWMVLSTIAPSTLDLSEMRLIPFLKKRDEVNHKRMCELAIEYGGYRGIADGERLLSWLNKTPRKFRSSRILLPAANLRTSESRFVVPADSQSKGKWQGHIVMPYLSCEGRDGEWAMEFNSIDCCYRGDDNCRFAVW